LPRPGLGPCFSYLHFPPSWDHSHVSLHQACFLRYGITIFLPWLVLKCDLPDLFHPRAGITGMHHHVAPLSVLIMPYNGDSTEMILSLSLCKGLHQIKLPPSEFLLSGINFQLTKPWKTLYPYLNHRTLHGLYFLN
jgi:hypothetical protein